MPITLREFTQAMNEWMPTAPPEAREHLRPSTWKQILHTGQDVDGGTRFSPHTIVDRVLNGRDDLAMDVALPVAIMLNRRFGPEHLGADAAEAPGPESSTDGLSPADPEMPPVPLPPTQSPSSASSRTAMPETSDTGANTEGSEESWDFPIYDYSREDLDSFEDSGNHVDVQVQRIGERFHYTWPDAGENEVYRVVVSDAEEPYSPDDFTEVAATDGTECWDETPVESAVRFITVWGYSRLSGSEILGQCRRVASRVVVHQLGDWTLAFNTESRAVEASWQPPVAPPGARLTVRTARLPLDQPVGRFLRGALWMSYEIPNNGAGFQDLDVVGGKTHNYVAAVEVEVAGRTYTSPPARNQITPEVVIEAIDDLSVDRRTEDAGAATESLTVRWTQVPSARVTVYRTSSPVAPEALDRGTVPVSRLPRAGLPEDAAISTAAGIDESGIPERQMRTLENVIWPSGSQWDTIHLTPVTMSGDGQATIGTPVRLKRAGRIENLTLTRRLDWELVTFAWPGDATSVELRITDPEASYDPAAVPIAEVTQDTYRAEGGVVVPDGLSPQGGRLYATAVTHLEGKRIPSMPTSIEVPAQWKYRYSISWPRWVAGPFRKTVVELDLTPVHGVSSEDDVIGVALIYREDRLPLHANDGKRVPVYLERPTKEGGQEPVPAVRVPPQGRNLPLWFDCAGFGAGYFRLMIDSVPDSAMEPSHRHQALERYALADPDLGQLYRKR
jgi:putative uncharacterized protein (fragment)